MTMRDVFFNRLYEYAKKDRNIVIVSADFSAPSLDKYRLEMPGQYVFCGISEQSMILLATGLALEGKKVFCYAIAPFLTMRCFEQIRNYPAGMNLPITLVGVGAGVAYDDSGYTHHVMEDIAIMRTLPHMRVFQPCDNADVERILEYSMQASHPMYVRLDRYGIDAMYKGERNVCTGLSVVETPQKVTIVASGSMVKVALEVHDQIFAEGRQVGLINLTSIPVDGDEFERLMSGVQTIITMEEHTTIGGIGSYILEIISERNLDIKVKRVGFDLSDGYVEHFGGRKTIYRTYRMDTEAVSALIRKEQDECIH